MKHRDKRNIYMAAISVSISHSVTRGWCQGFWAPGKIITLDPAVTTSPGPSKPIQSLT